MTENWEKIIHRQTVFYEQMTSY